MGYTFSTAKYPEGERTVARFLYRILATCQSKLGSEASEPVLAKCTPATLTNDSRACLQSQGDSLVSQAFSGR